ncbi:F-actin-monooxygenase MICAL3-like isoform X7 [Erpetoichthys calabaricus]|uniref:F-actin-monooxygenase MICAL3-like isoform X7 n=1 Tax=Erpetoichthys calabaricus TaxID=27687 RepID=UPI002234DD91|nr:F-actin-monooxygenase MICAL3-like isoform X7 [Erpetoichthys calabaricus]
MGENDEEKNNQAGQLFENFVQASTCKGTIQAFNILCRQLELSPEDYRNFFKTLKSKVTSWKAKALWSKLEKRASHKAYKDVCRNTKCLIIGGGPCGLRTAIELAFLGAKVVVLEKRDTFSRNNVLHLWPYTIHDLRGLGAKKFYGKFCAGSIDHISIRQLQLILVKVALILGVEFHVNVEFIKLLEPSHDNQGMGWRAEVCPADHPVASFDFDVIVGADGRRNTLEGFRRKEFRGKLAIAITANFINRNTTAEAKVEEISGVAFIFNQKFFQDLKEETGIDLENIVYYKDNTHYFVMTAKKQSLLDKGVIIYDYTDTEMLLSNENVNQEALLSYAREAADFATNYQLPSLDFAMNHCGQPDVAMFDFTCMYASENAALIRERRGQKLLVALVGDSLLEPFWPMGTGCARGFLAAFDTVWMVRSWALGRAPLEILAERESIYRLLPQTTPENITKNFDQYTIDPATRYPNLNSNCLQPFQIRHLYITSELKPCTVERAPSLRQSVNLSRRESEIRPNRLLTWCQKTTEGYRNVDVCNLTTSWKSGLALCAVIHHFRPDLIDFDSLDVEESTKNIQLAFDIAEQEFGISPVITAKEVAAEGEPDKLGMVLYLSKFYELFKGTQLISSGHKRGSGESNDVYLAKSSRKAHNINYTLPRKRTPKDEKKSEEDDATNKRRRRSFNYLEETSNISNWSTTSASECGEGRDSLNQNKVKSMASQLLAKFEENAPSTSLRRQGSLRKEFPQNLGGSDTCHFCKKRVYVMERLSAEGCFFHRECFRCDFCKSSLRLSNCAFDVDEGKFYCKPHYTQRKSSKYRKRHSEFPKEETDLSKQMEAAPSSPEAIKAYSAVSSLEGRPPGDYVQSLAGHIFPSDYANGHIFEDTYASFPTHPSTVKVVLEEDQILHSLVAERIMVISDASCSDTESDPFGSSFNGDYREEMTEENTQEDVVQRPDSDVPHSPNPTTTEEVILPPKASSSITLSPVTRWRKRIRNTLPIMMYKKKDQLVEDPPEDLQPSQSSPHQNPSQLVASPPLTPKSGGVHIYDLTPESDLPTSATQVLDSAKLFPSSDSLQTVVASGTYSDNENGQEDIDDTMNKSPKRKLVLPPNVKASLLDWELLATEDSKERGRHAQNERTKTEHCDAQKNDLGSSGSDSTASLPHSYHSHPEMQENSNCSSNLDPTPSPFHFLINAFRKTLNASKKMFSLDASEKTDSVTHSHSDGGLNSSKGKEDSKTEQLLKNSCTLSSQLHLNNQPETMTPIPKPVVVSNFHRDTHSELNVAQGKNTISPFSLQIDTEEKDDVDVSKNTKLKEDMSVLFKKVSLTGGSSRYSRNDLSFSQQKRLNEFSALQVNEPQDMKKNAKGKNSLWNLFSNVRKKTTEKKAPVRSRPWSSAHPEYSQQMSGINQQLAGDQMNLQETSSSSDDTQEKASSKLKASSSWRRKTRLEKSNRQQLRREELKRLHKAQIIQRQLQEVEERQRDLEERGVKLEKLLRGESDHKGNDETHLLHTWFKLVLEKNRLTRYESELMIFAQELELEDRQSRLQQILRERMSTDDSEKTKQDCAEEEKILNQILAVVEERNDLVGILDEQRLLEKAEDEDLECILLTRGYQFNWS